jgi:hypothetical protein
MRFHARAGNSRFYVLRVRGSYWPLTTMSLTAPNLFLLKNNALKYNFSGIRGEANFIKTGI